MISKDKVVIDTNMTVEEFLSHIQKGEEHQQLAVVPKHEEGVAEREKEQSEKMVLEYIICNMFRSFCLFCRK